MSSEEDYKYLGLVYIFFLLATVNNKVLVYSLTIHTNSVISK